MCMCAPAALHATVAASHWSGPTVAVDPSSRLLVLRPGVSSATTCEFCVHQPFCAVILGVGRDSSTDMNLDRIPSYLVKVHVSAAVSSHLDCNCTRGLVYDQYRISRKAQLHDTGLVILRA